MTDVGLDFEQAAALGEMILVKDAWCPTHGRSRPEMLAFPFTLDREALRFCVPFCPAQGCEESIVLDAEATDTRCAQHIALHQQEPGGWTDKDGYRPVYKVRPLAPGEWHVGVTSRQRDRPSGLAPKPDDLGVIDAYLRDHTQQ